MQGRRVVSVTVRPYDNLDILIQRHEEAEKTFDGKLTEFDAHDLRYIGLAFGGPARPISALPLPKAAPQLAN
jgi:hypothetical protein